MVSEHSGFYFSVLKEGEVGVGDELELIEKCSASVSVVHVTRLYSREKHNTALLKRGIVTEALPESGRAYFQYRLGKTK